MSKTIRIRKGLNINLKGEAEKVLATVDKPKVVAVRPPDIHGLVPKMVVKAGDKVRAGSALFHDKYNDKIKFTSPVSGEVAEVVRGAKRRIMEVRVLADGNTEFVEFGGGAAGSRDEIIAKLLETGAWPFIKQRPFDVVADPSDSPKAIFISGFNSAPLAPDMDFVVRNQGSDLQTGVDVISKLTAGKVHLGLAENSTAKELSGLKGVQITRYKGPHPAGNVGVQIHKTEPINKGEVVWTIGIQDLIIIGRLFSTGKFDARRMVALTGTGIGHPRYAETVLGSALNTLLTDAKLEGNRIISGNVLTGTRSGEDGYLGFYDDQITVIQEGDDLKFFLTEGWLSPGFDRLSASRAYPSWLMPGKKYALDTNQNGEERAFVVTGQYEKVFPFDIYPVQLLKSVMVNDIELMEQLGMYEVAPEDFALCEFVCTSKIDSQRIVREGLDMLKKETT
jgi:Na+-transporting NADH:ubiquinone oxidoreductase subunit A